MTDIVTEKKSTAEDSQTQPSAQPAQAAVTQAKKSLAPHKVAADWKPLGTVRDYFNEQMRQDNFR